MTDTVLRLIGVTQQYGSGTTAVSALAGVDFEVSKGELVAVMGPSGSGKSTLLAIAGGLATPTTGEVVIEGAYLSEQSARDLARVAVSVLVLGPAPLRSDSPGSSGVPTMRRSPPSAERGRCAAVSAPTVDPAAISLPPTQPIDITELAAQSTFPR